MSDQPTSPLQSSLQRPAVNGAEPHRFAILPGLDSPQRAAMPAPAPSIELDLENCSEEQLPHILSMLLNRSGLTIAAAAKEMGMASQSLRQYVKGRRPKPGLGWFLRFAALTGATVRLEWPQRKR